MRAAPCVIVAALAAFAATVPAAAGQNARWGAGHFPNVPLVTQDGKTVRFYDDLLRGKIVAINLIYTTCRYACPLETARLAQVQRVLGERMGTDVFFYSITIDPEHDTPPVLREYARRFQAGPGWLFLTGAPADIDLISRKTGLYSAPGAVNADGHTPSLLLGNETTGQWMRTSAVDNAKFLARTIGEWLNSWQGPRRARRSYADAPQMTMERGEYVFRSHCAACHTIGDGDRVGPDLRGVTRTRDRTWLRRFILQPDVMLASGDPTARALVEKYSLPMPNLSLSQEDVAAVLDFIDRQATPVTNVHAAGSAPAMLSSTLIAAYLRVQEALSADTIDGLQDSARTIEVEASRLGATRNDVTSAAGALHQSADLVAARDAFGRLSDAIVALARVSRPAAGDQLRVAYCPMAQKSWLQKGTSIRNPYYGKSMLACGRVTTVPPDATK